MHLFELSVVFGLLGLEIELHVLQVLQVLVLYLLTEGLLLSSCFLCLAPVFLLNGFYHVIQFLEVIVVSLLHFLSFSDVLIFEDVDVSLELLHQSVYSRVLYLSGGVCTSKRVSMWMRWFRTAIWY